jgi:hypothetical protein
LSDADAWCGSVSLPWLRWWWIRNDRGIDRVLTVMEQGQFLLYISIVAKPFVFRCANHCIGVGRGLRVAGALLEVGRRKKHE